jgi:hypothetical protein
MIAGNFESGSAQMKSVSLGTFDRIADLLRKREYRLRIEGHTDNSPIHTAQFRIGSFPPPGQPKSCDSSSFGMASLPLG